MPARRRQRQSAAAVRRSRRPLSIAKPRPRGAWTRYDLQVAPSCDRSSRRSVVRAARTGVVHHRRPSMRLHSDRPPRDRLPEIASNAKHGSPIEELAGAGTASHLHGDRARCFSVEGSLRRLLAIGFVAKESSDVNEPHDPSVANPIVSSAPRGETKALVDGMRGFRAKGVRHTDREIRAAATEAGVGRQRVRAAARVRRSGMRMVANAVVSSTAISRAKGLFAGEVACAPSGRSRARGRVRFLLEASHRRRRPRSETGSAKASQRGSEAGDQELMPARDPR